MPDVAKLKKKAAEFELKKQFDKALAVYVEILDSYGPSDEDVDVSLYNRVGDLFLKQGSVGDAVDYYEQAVDRYAESGFHNNAIALCNKILRQSPGRASIYYKLGKISAQKGFKGDAKKNFLEYADRMQGSGQIDEAFRALKEFADLCPDQDDIRQMLAEQLSKKGRTDEAIEQLQLLHERYVDQGRNTEALATVNRMKAIDPASAPRTSSTTTQRVGDSLVFLDLNDAAPPKRPSSAFGPTEGLSFISTGFETPRVSPTVPAPTVANPTPAVALPEPIAEVLETPLIDPPLLDGVTRIEEFEQSPASDIGSSLLYGLESTSIDDDTDTGTPLIDLETTSFEGEVSPPLDMPVEGAAAELLDLEVPPIDDAHARTPASALEGLPMLIDDEGEEPEAIAHEDIVTEVDEVPEEEESIGGDLPLMDLDLPMLPTPGEATAAITGIPARNNGQFDLTTPPVQRTPVSSDPIDITTPAPVRRAATELAEHSAELLQARLDAEPDDNHTRRQLGEAMLESGDREGGLRELEAAMIGYERADDLASASRLADEIVLLNPDSVKHHQKRVEYAFRTNERGRLLEAYLQLADAMFRAGQLDKSRAIYQRVIDLAPDDLRAQAALESFPTADATPEPPAAPTPPKRSGSSQHSASAPPAAAPRAAAPVAEEYINFGDWLREGDAPKDTRMVVEEKEPTGDEEADFQDMLRKFKQGISENVEEEDHQSHYDLGVAYKEMGLLDEAVSEFQKALRAPSNRVPTYEALGQCFMEKNQFPMAATILGRALHERGIGEDQLVGVLYLLGRCAEVRGLREQAVEFYQRVFVVDIQFRDVGERLAAVEGAAS